jgi:hypothetical protein
MTTDTTAEAAGTFLPPEPGHCLMTAGHAAP